MPLLLRQLVFPLMAARALKRPLLHIRMTSLAVLVCPFLAEPLDLADALHVTFAARAGPCHMLLVGKGYLVLEFDHLGSGKGRS